MFKDIVVNLSVRKGSKAVGDYAVSVAETLEAHLTGVAVAFVPSIPGASLGYLPIETIEAQQRENEMAAEDAVDHFTAASAKAGVAAERRVLRTGFPAAAEQFSRIARRFDLAIVGQVEPDVNSVEAAIAESTLFDSGRPIVIVPYIQKAPLTLERVMVCWDGSRAAARAIADAMPLLERAGSVQVVIVTSERGKYDQIEGADMGAHLARHGLNVEVTRTALGDIDVADVILSRAADMSTDFIVMGGYGHSRLRE